MKKCSRCREIKSLTEFYRNKNRRDGYGHYCKPCTKIVSRNAPSKTRQARRVEKLKSEYGLSVEQFEAIIVAQDNKCAICRMPFTQEYGEGGRAKGVAKRCVDHDHVSNRVRGLLCQRCNVGLGMFKDNQSLLEEAARYLSQQP